MLKLPSPPIASNAATATKILGLIETQEGEYQMSLAEAYHDLGEKTFKGLRRMLPLTRQKLDWDKVSPSYLQTASRFSLHKIFRFWVINLALN